MMRVIKVYGKLAKHLGQRSFKAVARTPGDAVKFLLANFPDLRSVLSEGEYTVSVGRHQLPIGEHPEFIGYPVAGSEPIRIVPVISGAGGNTGAILAGAALIAVAIAAPGAGLFAGGSIGFGSTAAAGAATLGGSLAVAAGNIGIALVLGGIAGIIAPVPKTPEMDSDPRENFNFSGVQNTSRSGVVVPVIYGEVVTGSITISAGLNTEGD
ncbi:lambda tail assembly protein I-like protein [uncultured Mediterranean phage uvMED]|nr:lambda tail assembly protein I-like protein [uncultured Mediterranean phage uvMED]BAR23903.1 Phage-related protein, tail component (COG4723) [uncultured Mediterranean phage uvMED]BAR23958.1 Phage-related protein, tail component (COG4723) [uncultured Mediterranean phage uvMED]BAR24001.1 Phage-related protein, tail component (COG4723) [uncultured Mediterranean phage uvMED]BAR24069.1 Phage-related protein, tail component (COG4723) [uncultured Mediterranean phage uvMED]